MTDPDVVKASEEIAAKYGDWIREQVDKWPPLTQEQKDKLAVILRRPRKTA